MVVINNNVLFGGGDALHGIELWKTDGATGGTKLVKDIAPGSTGSNPEYFTLLNNNIYFLATNSSGYKKLWQTDGTAVGTFRVEMPASLLNIYNIMVSQLRNYILWG